MALFSFFISVVVGFSAFANTSNEQALFEAVKRGNVASVKELLSSGTNPNIKNENGRHPLTEAMYFSGSDSETTVLALSKVLVENGADVNGETVGWTALNIGANIGYVSVVKYLIDEGANVNAMDSICGRSVLWLAAYNGKDQVVLELLKHPVEINQRSCDGITPLGIAKQGNFSSTVSILCANGGTE